MANHFTREEVSLGRSQKLESGRALHCRSGGSAGVERRQARAGVAKSDWDSGGQEPLYRSAQRSYFVTSMWGCLKIGVVPFGFPLTPCKKGTLKKKHIYFCTHHYYSPTLNRLEYGPLIIGELHHQPGPGMISLLKWIL